MMINKAQKENLFYPENKNFYVLIVSIMKFWNYECKGMEHLILKRGMAIFWGIGIFIFVILKIRKKYFQPHQVKNLFPFHCMRYPYLGQKINI